MDEILQALYQYKIGRILFGGEFVKMNNRWYAADVIKIEENGVRVLRLQTSGDIRTMSFYETDVSVQGRESFA